MNILIVRLWSQSPGEKGRRIVNLRRKRLTRERKENLTQRRWDWKIGGCERCQVEMRKDNRVLCSAWFSHQSVSALFGCLCESPGNVLSLSLPSSGRFPLSDILGLCSGCQVKWGRQGKTESVQSALEPETGREEQGRWELGTETGCRLLVLRQRGKERRLRDTKNIHCRRMSCHSFSSWMDGGSLTVFPGKSRRMKRDHTRRIFYYRIPGHTQVGVVDTFLLCMCVL